MKINQTKKIIGFFTIASVVLLIGCKEQPKEQPQAQPAQKEVIIVPAPAPVVIEKEAPESSTTIKLDKNGLEVDAKKVNVKIE